MKSTLRTMHACNMFSHLVSRFNPLINAIHKAHMLGLNFFKILSLA